MRRRRRRQRSAGPGAPTVNAPPAGSKMLFFRYVQKWAPRNRTHQRTKCERNFCLNPKNTNLFLVCCLLCFFLFKLGTRYNTVNFIFFFSTSFGCWHLKTWTSPPPPIRKGRYLCFFFVTAQTATSVYSPHDIKGRTSPLPTSLSCEYLPCFMTLKWVLQRHKALKSSATGSYRSHKVSCCSSCLTEYIKKNKRPHCGKFFFSSSLTVLNTDCLHHQ